MQLLGEVDYGWITQGPPMPQWTLDVAGRFTVSSMYKALTSRHQADDTNFPVEAVWVTHVPTKISGFVWQVAHKNISSFENLQKRGFVGPNWCVMCRAGLESVSHLFLDCPFALQIWYTFSSKLAIWGPEHFDVREVIRGWQGRNCDGSFEEFRSRLLHAIFWYIWGERNSRIFRDRESSVVQVVKKIAWAVGRWLAVADRLSRDVIRSWFALWRLVFDPD
ncbi:Putative ribonuclease H protein At1g65750 [Linum perenne]